MLRTIFTIKGEKKSAKVLLVDPLDNVFSTWWNRPAYFVTTSSGEFFSCSDEQVCIAKAKELAKGK
jgi:hypothetical protein